MRTVLKLFHDYKMQQQIANMTQPFTILHT